MKGRELTIEEVLKLEDGTKFWVEDIKENYEPGIYKVNAKELIPINQINQTKWLLWTKGSRVDSKRIRVYEWKEDVKVKEYQTWEAIKMLSENPKSKFTASIDKYKATLGILEVNDSNYIEMIFDREYSGWEGNLMTNTMWTLVSQPVSFMEAVQAYSEGENLKLINDKETYYFKKKTLGASKDNMLRQFIDEDGNGINCEDILEGVWFIDED